ncbi:hypothetical protein MH928_17400 [Flavobacterium sp. WW92]|uniref:hypothetical protein n=1 Tax=unclassified Flavobacterium TaxID=196869 RepID=UPI00222528D2|nr:MULTISPECIES: hypothetical protein [unclassified Flavobacterium]WDO13085.1 hypothetical protein MH928_17400 [Flavobacterium sp. WW92]
MSPKVLSMLNNAKIFLSSDELRELALCIEKELGKAEAKKTKRNALEGFTLESVTADLMATHFNKNRRNKNTSSK